MSTQTNGRPDLPLLDLHFLGCEADWQQAAVILFGAPYDGTASFRPGSRFGPAAMRLDSAGLETYSPYLGRDLLASRICDLGDLELPPGDRAVTLARIRTTAAAICAAGKKPVMLGGEHLVSLPAVEACLEQWPDLCLIHLDAHADLRQDYLGESLSHATVMHRIWDQLGDGRIWQLGIRSGCADEFAFARAGHTRFFPFELQSIQTAIREIGARPVWLSVDLDVLDPSVFPGTGTPEPGGAPFADLLQAVHALRAVRLVGADLVELAPHYDSSGCSTAVALKILRELLLVLDDPDRPESL